MNWRISAGCLVVVLTMGAGSTQAQFRLPRFPDFELPDKPQTPADRTRSEADSAYQQGDFKRVIDITSPLIELDPNDHVALYLRASAQIELGRIARSNAQVRAGIADARQSVQVAGRRFAWLHIPYFYGMTSLAELEKRPEHADPAISVAGTLLERPDLPSADRANVLYQRALAYTAKKQLQAAANDFTQAIQHSPKFLGAYIKRSEALAALGQSKQALASYDEAVDVFPDTLLVYNDRGSYRRTLGDLDGAISDFTRALQIDPGFAIGYINRGISLTDLNQPLAAESDLNQALVADPKLQWVVGLRGAVRLAQGRVTAAIDDFTRYIKLYPQFAGGYADRGFANFAARRYAAAHADFTRALEIDPAQQRLLPWKIIALSRAYEGEKARAAIDAAIAGKSPPPGWIGQICRYLAGQVEEQELLDASRSSNAREQSERMCEVQFFIGEKKLVENDEAAARSHFQASTKTNMFHLSAYRCARYELGELKAE